MNPNDIKNWLNQPARYGFESVRKQAALRYIEELEAKTPKWISVEESLPENLDNVLICDGGGGIVVGHYDEDDGRFWKRVNGNTFHSVDATHWMSLPELPKETEE